MLKIIISFIILIFLLISILYTIKAMDTPRFYKGPLSDHFNGKTFYNPGPYHLKSTLDILRWRLSSRTNHQTWPTRVKIPPPMPILPVTADNQIKITFVNHATFLIQSKTYNILTDPIWSERASPFSWIGPARVHPPGIDFEKLPPIQFVLISHNHYDHMDIPTLLRLEQKFHPIFIVPLGNKAFLMRKGLHRVIELDWWQQYRTPQLILTLLPTKHWSARWLNDKFRTLWGGYGIAIANKKIFFAGDTGYSTHFQDIANKWGHPTVALLPIGAYLPEWFMKENHLNPQEAVKAHQDLHAQYSIGMHFGTFQLSNEAYHQPLQDLATALQMNHVSAQQFIILNPGQNQTF